MKYCSKCDLKISDNNHYCPQCYGKISLICPSCGAENEEDSEFCGECGARIISGNSQADDKPKVTASVNTQKPQQQSSFSSYSYANSGQQNSNSGSRSYTSVENSGYSSSGANGKVELVDNTERIIATMGSGYVSNIISNGAISSTSAVLTNKRVYCSGNMLVKDGKIWRKMKMSKIVEAVDITGTGFTYSSQVEWLIGLILDLLFETILIVNGSTSGFTTFLFIALLIIFIILFIVNRKTIFQVEYAGGAIGFNVNWLNPREMVNFQKQIHRIKNKCRAEERENG